MKNRPYNDYAVMEYVMWILCLSLSCIVSQLYFKAILIVASILWPFISSQFRRSWVNCLIFRFWVGFIFFAIGFMHLADILEMELAKVTEQVGIAVLLFGLVSIHILWKVRLKKSINKGMSDDEQE